MPTPQAELFDTHVYLPGRGGFRLREAPSADVRSLRDITGGKFDLFGSAIVDTQTRRFVGNISSQSETNVSVGTRGTILLHNVVQQHRLQDVMGTRAIPSAIISGDLTGLGVETGDTVNRMITLAPRNSLIYVDQSKPAGKGRYTRIDAGVFGDIPPPLVNEFGRLATSGELMVRGVAGWLSRNAPAALDRLKLGGYTLPDGTTTTVGSEIVKAIAANISVVPMVTYVLSEGD